MANWNKYYRFLLRYCINGRIILWNVFDLRDDVQESLKLLFGGDRMSVPMKCESDGTVSRTSMIVLSNDDSFPVYLAFGTRMIGISMGDVSVEGLYLNASSCGCTFIIRPVVGDTGI
jgi:hypothetical protein